VTADSKTAGDGTSDRPIFASEVDKYLGSLGDAKMWQPLEKEGQEWVRFILGAPDEPNAPQIWFIRLPPNHVTERHYHNVHRLDLLLDGSYTLEGVERKKGDITVFSAGKMYGPIVHGPEGSLQMEIFADGSKLQAIFEKPPSESVIKNFARMGLYPSNTTEAVGHDEQ
jgi:hypothetical protein